MHHSSIHVALLAMPCGYMDSGKMKGHVCKKIGIQTISCR